jgi:very-short-patch-repair endonuclease
MRVSRKIVERARKLRRVMTAPEVRLWQWLRGKPGDLKFRRQHPVGHFVLDFYCPATRLVIEVDGEAHSRGDQPRRDTARDAWCAGQGLRVLRIPALSVMNDLDSVARGILAVCHEQLSRLPLHHSPEEANGPSPHASHGEE